MLITCSECVFVALFIQHAYHINSCRNVLQSVACLAPVTFCTLSHERKNFGKDLLNTKMFFFISLQILSETFFILRTNQWDITVSGRRFSCELLDFFSEFSHTWIFRRIFEKYPYLTFHENSSGWSRVLPCGQKEGRTVGQTQLTKLLVTFRRLSNASKER